MTDNLETKVDDRETATRIGESGARRRRWLFPSLKRPSVFIAAPGDLAHLRRTAARMLNDLKNQAADDHGAAVYDWTIDMAPNGFVDWIPAQGQIPLPSDELCRAVICMFGERIGTPLPATFDISPISDLGKPRPGPRVVHPWDARAAEDGGFSLTGTVFELLAAIDSNAHGASSEEERWRGTPPLLLLFVGGESLDSDLPPIDMGWGNYRLDAEALSKLQASHPKTWRTRYAAWRDNEYIPQLTQVRNLFRFVQSQGIVPRIVQDEVEAQDAIRDFLARSLRLGTGDGGREPFLGLAAFDVEDQRVFFGRKDERHQMMAAFAELWDDPARPNFFGIIGGSGVGKSSMLRAGLIASLCDPLSPDRYLACIVRTAELLPSTWARRTELGYGHAADALQELMARIFETLECDEAFEEAQRRLATIRDRHQGEEALEMVTCRLGANSRLLIAFDQFEELVDQLSDPRHSAVWNPVVDLIRAAAWDRRIGVLYTLQENRQDSLASHPVLGALFEAGRARSLSFPTQGLDEIIRGPFRSRGFRLEAALVRELRHRILEFAAFQDATVQGSLLPLVSVTLKRIYERGTSLLDDEEGVAEPRVLRLATCKDLLEVGDAIAELAQTALARAKAVSGPAWSERTLGGFLRMLVRRQGRGDRLSLPPVPMPSTVAGRHLAEAFLAWRLLVPTEDGRVRLVHEALLRHWPPAVEWLEEERSLLEDSILLGLQADAWDRGGRSPDRLRAEEVERAAALLLRWVGNLGPREGYSLSPEDARLRDYGLALLTAHARPGLRVESSTCMHVATAYGDASLVRKYLELDPDVIHQRREDGRTPLFAPCFLGDEKVVAMLLENRADPESADQHGWRPIHAAATEGHVRVVELLVEAGAAVDARGGGGATPLELAARNGKTELVTRLLEMGAEPESRTDRGWAPLHTAVFGGHVDAAKALLEHGANIESRVHGDLLWGQGLGKGGTALHLAAKKGFADLAALLIDGGADLEALMEAQSLRAKLDPGTVDLLAEADFAKDAATPLHIAVQEAAAEVAWVLLEAGADSNAMRGAQGTPLHAAAQRDNAHLVAILLGHGADPEIPRQDGMTPLHIARFIGNEDVVSLMLARLGSETDAAEADGELPSGLLLAGGHSLPWYRWTPGAGEELAGLLELLHPIDGRWPLDDHQTRVAIAYLPWYSEVALIEIRNPSWRQANLRIYFLKTRDGGLYRLNGTSLPIYEVNEVAKLRLNAENVLDYVRFFCLFVRGPDGPFYILEDANDPLLPPFVDPATRTLLEHLVRPAELEGRNDEGSFVCRVTIFYSDALFRVTYEVRENGKIFLTEDEPIAADLPFRMQAPLK